MATPRYPIFESLSWPHVSDYGRAIYISHQPQRKALHWAVCEWTPQGGEQVLGNYGSLWAAVQRAVVESGWFELKEPS